MTPSGCFPAIPVPIHKYQQGWGMFSQFRSSFSSFRPLFSAEGDEQAAEKVQWRWEVSLFELVAEAGAQTCSTESSALT